jgi:alkanesulfonate monooxygenase SsuD/methylene tetrahydromethanopterin reductase-like flavin-dependent oxidoreductase (luciferase family)
MPAEFFLYLPQMRMEMSAIVERAQTAEAAGYTGIGLMDHLAPPLAEKQPMQDAMVTASWLLARTERLKVGHLVLCDAFRHPAVLAKQVVSLDHASGGRFELGLGWGSVPAEFERFGVMTTEPPVRVARMTETLEVLHELWTGNPVTYNGKHHNLAEAQQNPPPLGRIPIVIGGAGKKTLALVARYADWWNLAAPMIDRVDELRDQIGNAGISVQEQTTFIPSEAEREAITETAMRRFGSMGSGPTIGNGAELRDHFGAKVEKGITRFYVWFTDFAKPETIEAFGKEVVAPLSS